MKRLIPAFLTLAVAACADLGLSQPDWTWLPPGPSVESPRAENRAAPAQASRPAARTPDLKALKPQPRPSIAAPAPAEDKLAPRLVGLSEVETEQLLGRPAEESAEPPGKTWIYKAAGCRLSVHLFPDMEKGGFYALDYTVAEGTREACLVKVAGEARRKGSALDQEAVRKG